MTFTKWYETSHGDWWHEDYEEQPKFAAEMRADYADWCREHDVTPVQNGQLTGME